MAYNFVRTAQIVLDVREIYAIITISAIKIPRQLYYAQSTTGGRLGVKLCQM